MGYTINCVTFYKQKLYFTLKEYAGLFEYSYIDKRLSLVAVFEKDKFTANNLCYCLCTVGDSIIISPGLGDCFYIYSNGVLKHIDLPDDIRNRMRGPFKTQGIKFYDGFARDGKAYFVGWSINSIIEVDPESENVKEFILSQNVNYMCMASYFMNDLIYLTSRTEGKIVTFDIKLNSYQDIGIDVYLDTCGVVKYQGELFCFRRRNENLYVYKDKWDIVQGLGVENRYIKKAIVQCGKLWVFFERNNSISYIKGNTIIDVKLKNVCQFNAVGLINEGYIWGFDIINSELIIVDAKDDSVQYIKLPYINNLDNIINMVDFNHFCGEEALGINLDFLIKSII